MKVRGRLRAARKTTLAVVAVSLLVISGGGGVASAATTSDLLYSTDGGATWSSSVTVAPGATVQVRQWYDNDGEASETDASLTTQIPAGFTRTSGTTQVCLNPSTTNPASPDDTELKCEASNEGAVWSGSDLQVSPIAGHYGESNGQTSGPLPFGRTRYLNLQECRYDHDTGAQFARVLNLPSQPNFTAASNASNTAGTGGDCGPAGVFGWTFYSQNEQSFDLLSNRYANLQECRYTHDTGAQFARVLNLPSEPNFTAASNASNTAGTGGDCGPAGVFGWTLNSQNEQSFDLLSNRYVNLQECRYVHDEGAQLTRVIDTPTQPNFTAASNASNTAGTGGDCGPAGVFGWTLNSQNEQVFDLLDQARGRGFVEYAITAPPMDSACADDAEPLVGDQTATLTSTPSGASSSSGTITVEPALLDPDDPECVIPMVDPMAVGIGGGMAAVAAAAYVLHRRRQVTLA